MKKNYLKVTSLCKKEVRTLLLSGHIFIVFLADDEISVTASYVYDNGGDNLWKGSCCSKIPVISFTQFFRHTQQSKIAQKKGIAEAGVRYGLEARESIETAVDEIYSAMRLVPGPDTKFTMANVSISCKPRTLEHLGGPLEFEFARDYLTDMQDKSLLAA